jgi:DNA transposition AAA+ family ATPase
MQRVLPKPYAERDVADVELYVRDAVDGLGDVLVDEQDRLVARGIFVVRRIAQALPPEVSLQQTLSGTLTEALAAHRARTRRDVLSARGRAA